MAATPPITPQVEWYGPPEAQDTTQSNPVSGPISMSDSSWGGTDHNSGMGGYSLDLTNLLTLIVSVIADIIQGLIDLSTWIANQFEGVPQQAKTMGTGQRMIHIQDPISHWIGINLIDGAAKGRVLSEGNWPHNFAGHLIAMGGALIELANREPPEAQWHVRTISARQALRIPDATRQFAVGPLAPPLGAPYNQSVIVDGFFAHTILDAQSYQLKFGFTWPTPQQLVDFINQTRGVLWDEQIDDSGLLYQMRDSYLQLWQQKYSQWWQNNKPPPPGPNPDPCQLPEDPPCPPPSAVQGDQLTDLIGAEQTYLYYIARGLKRLASAAESPQDAVCCSNVVAAIGQVSAQLTQLVAATQNEGGTPVDLTGIVAALGQLLAAVQGWPALWQVEVGALINSLGDLTNAVNTLGSSSSGDSIVKELAKWNAINDIPPSLLNQAITDKVLPPQYAQFLQGSPAEIAHFVLRLAALISKPIGDLERWAGDDSDAIGAEKMRLDLIKRGASATKKALAGLAGVPPGDFSKDLQSVFSTYLKTNDAIVTPILQPLLNSIKAQLSPTAGPLQGPGLLNVNPDAPVASATGVALTAALAAWAASFAGVDEGESLTKMAEIFAGAIGWEQLRDVQIGPLVRNGIGAVAEMNARMAMRQWLPAIGEVLNLYSRNMINDASVRYILTRWGVSDGQIPVMEAASYHGWSPRAMLRAVESGLFNNSDLTDELTYSGMRPASQQRFLLAAPYLATERWRSTLRSAIEAAYEAGLYSDQQMVSAIDSAEHNTDRDNLIMQTAQIKRLTEITKSLEAAYTTEHEAGITDLPTFQSKLQGIGLQQIKVTALVAIAEAKLNATLKRQADAAERTLVRETAAIERKTALENFKVGMLSTAGLAAALVATGLTAVQAAAWTDLATLQKGGALRWIYGLQKTPSDATLLAARVADLLDQRKKEMIDGSTLVKSLSQLGLSVAWQNALLARANADITPKQDRTYTPVTTSG